MRYLARHQGINIRFLHGTFNPKDDSGDPLEGKFDIEYIESNNPRADIFTKAIRETPKWKITQQQINIIRTARNSNDVPIVSIRDFSTRPKLLFPARR